MPMSRTTCVALIAAGLLAMMGAVSAKPAPKPAAKPPAPKVFGAANLSKTHSHFPALPAGQAYALTFHDEFDSLSTTKAKWNLEDRYRRVGNWWSPQCVKVRNGKFEGWTLKHPTRDNACLTAAMTTKGKFTQAYGLYTCRVKFQTAKGFWSAFWMMCGQVNRVGDDGRDGMEIDIWEKFKLDDRIGHALHWDYYNDSNLKSSAKQYPAQLNKDYNTISMLWTPKEYVFYVNGKEAWRTNAGGVCQVPGYLKLTGESGPSAGKLDYKTLPNAFYIDYVRVYQIVNAKTKTPVYRPKPEGTYPPKPKPKVFGIKDLPRRREILPSLPAGQAFKLTFHDEFDSLETTKKRWTIVDADRTCRDKNWWGPQAVKIKNGKLECWTLKHPTKPGWHITACLNTKGKFAQAYGLYVSRVKFQTAVGFWSAFWMMCGQVTRVGDDGRDGTEIDIWEKNSLDDQIQHTLHWDGYQKGVHKSAGKRFKCKTAMKGYHTISLLWTPKEYVYYVDGIEAWRTSAGGVCNVAGYLKISGEIGTWAGDIKKTKLPNAFSMDFVRVYQIVDAKTAEPIYTPKTAADFPKPKPKAKS